MYDWIVQYFHSNESIINFGIFLLCMMLIFVPLIFYTKLKNLINKERISTQAYIYVFVYFSIISSQYVTALSLFILIFFILREMISYGQKLDAAISLSMLSISIILTLPLASLIALVSMEYMPVYIYFVFLTGAFIVITFNQSQQKANALIFIAITCLIVISLDSLLYLRAQAHGLELCLFTLFLTNISDTVALLGGSVVGKNKLLYEISPNKTIEGSVAAIVATILIAFVFNSILMIGLLWWQIIIIAMAISVSGQLGDMIASIAKRKAAIKDFSNALPGHGGFLDRCDSLILSLPTAICLLVVMNVI